MTPRVEHEDGADWIKIETGWRLVVPYQGRYEGEMLTAYVSNKWSRRTRGYQLIQIFLEYVLIKRTQWYISASYMSEALCIILSATA